MKPNYLKFIKKFGKNKVLINEPLKKHTSIKIGGPADLFFQAATQQELIDTITFCSQNKIPYFVLGGGSNTLIPDKGFRGLVIKNKSDQIKILKITGNIKAKQAAIKSILLEADSGVLTNRLVRYCLNEGWGGLEHFLGLPGTVGGAIWGNAHYDGHLIDENVFQVKILDASLQAVTLLKDQCRFAYQDSRFKKTNEIILSAIFILERKDKRVLWQRAEQSLQKRSASQPQQPSLGCVFQNIKKSEAMMLSTPNQTQSAGYLIEVCGLKGTQIGSAKISETHGNFIVNLNGAKAADVLELIQLVKEKVYQRFKLKLNEEIVIKK
jgi:UDP-N-acetylmuramate dehydrogenase